MHTTLAKPTMADREHIQTRFIIAAGVILVLFFAVFTFLYPLASLYSQIIPNAIKTKPVWGLIDLGVIVLDKPLYVVAFVCLFVVYLGAFILAIRRAGSGATHGERDGRTARVVLLAGILSAVILLWSYPLFSQDVFDYVFHTHEWVRYGASPFTHVPSQFSFDPLYRYVSWTEAPSPYGPIWILLTAPLSWLAVDSLFLNLIFFKGLTVLCYSGSAYLLYRTLGRVLPRYRLAGTIAFAWNPLVLMEFAGSGHNDIVMIFFAMLALWLVTSGRFALSLAALTASMLVKVLTILVLPLFFLYILKHLLRERAQSSGIPIQGQNSMMPSGSLHFRAPLTSMARPRLMQSVAACVLLSVGVVVLSYAPLWEGINSLAFLRRGDIVGGAPVGNVVTDLISSAGFGHDSAASIWKIVSQVGFAALILRQAWVIWRESSHKASQLPGFSHLNNFLGLIVDGRRSAVAAQSPELSNSVQDTESGIERLARTSMSIMFFYAVVVSQYYQPWYLSWSLMWVGLMLKPGNRVVVWTLLIFSAVAVAGYVYL